VSAQDPALPASLSEIADTNKPAQLAETDTRALAGPTPSSVQALKAAARNDVALVKQCGRKSDGTCALSSCSCEDVTA
jgi:type VI secretion system secreted protein VgrG